MIYRVKDIIDTILQGNALEILKEIPNESIDIVITSPPYWSLRSYKTNPIIWDSKTGCQHRWVNYTARLIHQNQQGIGGALSSHTALKKGLHGWGNSPSAFCSKCRAWRGELGLEPTPGLYIKHLCDILDEVKRVLKGDGSCWLNIADSYGGSLQGFGGENRTTKTKNRYSINAPGQPQFIPPGRYMTSKSLVGIPEMFVLEMQKRGWIRRNTIIWAKPNCMPASATDRFTVDFEYLYFFTKSPDYFFDQQFDIYTKSLNRWGGEMIRGKYKAKTNQYVMGERAGRNLRPNPTGRNKRCVWVIPTCPLDEKHAASYPTQLCEIPIRATCPKFICKKCGKPRIVIWKKAPCLIKKIWRDKTGEQIKASPTNTLFTKQVQKKIGFELTDCGCGASFDSGIVLDPFAGAGTTCLVARSFGRHYIGIEISPEYIDIAKRRIRGIPSNILSLRKGG